MDEPKRIARERDYHNQRFTDDSEREQRVGRFYCAIDYGFELYKRRVSAESRGSRLLEYGCGTGSLAFDLAEVSRHVIGIDISDVAILQAQQTAKRQGLSNVEFRVTNAEAKPPTSCITSISPKRYEKYAACLTMAAWLSLPNPWDTTRS